MRFDKRTLGIAVVLAIGVAVTALFFRGDGSRTEVAKGNPKDNKVVAPDEGPPADSSPPSPGPEAVAENGGTKPPPLKAELAGEYLKKFMSRHKEMMKESGEAAFHMRVHRFRYEEFYGFREGRLLALSFPGETERLAIAIAGDPGREELDRRYSVYLLGVLMGAGRREAEDALYRMAMDNDPQSSLAAYELLNTDATGKYMTFYWSKFTGKRFEESTAFDAAVRWGGPSYLPQLDSIAAGASADGTVAWCAADAAKKIRALSSSDWQAYLERGVETGKLEETDFQKTPWILKIARDRSLPTLKECLRRRIDKAERIDNESARSKIEEEFVSGEISSYRNDPCIDELLLAYKEAGGKLNDQENGRLRTFGYGCDPKERLAELMAEPRDKK